MTAIDDNNNNDNKRIMCKQTKLLHCSGLQLPSIHCAVRIFCKCRVLFEKLSRCQCCWCYVIMQTTITRADQSETLDPKVSPFESIQILFNWMRQERLPVSWIIYFLPLKGGSFAVSRNSSSVLAEDGLLGMQNNSKFCKYALSIIS